MHCLNSGRDHSFDNISLCGNLRKVFLLFFFLYFLGFKSNIKSLMVYKFKNYAFYLRNRDKLHFGVLVFSVPRLR